MDALKQMCRLCSQTKMLGEKMFEINDLILGIKQKLIDCCRWRDLEKFDNGSLPQNVCFLCVQKLEQCWEFAESVSAAQQNLLRIIGNIKSESLGEETAPMKIHTFEFDDTFKCDIDLGICDENIHGKEKITFEMVGVNEDASVAEELSHGSTIIHEFKRTQTNGAKNDDMDCETIPLTPKMRKKKDARLTIVKPKMKNMEKKSTEKLHKQTKEVIKEGEKEKVEKNIESMLKGTTVSGERKKSTKPSDSFLTLIQNEDRNDDGTIRPERILQLELGSWLMLQYQCYVCGTCLGDYYKLRQHLLEEHPQDPFRLLCSFCKKPRTLKRKQAMIDHTKVFHFPHLKYCCWKCNKFYWDNKKMREHVFGHKTLPNLTELVGVLCDHCGKTCRDDSHFRQHSISHMPAPKKRTFQCYMCKKIYASKLALDYHMFDHFGGQKYKCDQCQFEFKRKDSLKRHTKTHSNDFAFPCPDCDKKFKTKKSVIEHHRIHTGMRPFQCNLCPYNCADMRNIYKHIKQKHHILGGDTRLNFTIDSMA